jgi:hypothetical protein
VTYSVFVILAVAWLSNGDNTISRERTTPLPNTPVFQTLADCGTFIERNRSARTAPQQMLQEFVEDTKEDGDAILLRKAVHVRCYRSDKPTS